MLDTCTVLPGEGMASVSGVVLETARKLKEGDGLLGWEGDEFMELFVNLDESDPDCGTYDVWTARRDPAGNVIVDAAGIPKFADLVVSARPYADDRLLRDVIHADSRRFDVVKRIEIANEANQREARAQARGAEEERADKLHHALTRDIGHLYSGMSRRGWGYG